MLPYLCIRRAIQADQAHLRGSWEQVDQPLGEAMAEVLVEQKLH